MFRVILLFLVAFFLFASFAQTSTANESFRVLENETQLVLADNQASVSLAIEDPSVESFARIKLEIVAPNDNVQAIQESSQKIGRGKQTLIIPIDILNAGLIKDNILWYRLRYEITPEKSEDAKTNGIVSFSQILPEVFDLKTASGYPFGEKLFRVRVQAVNPTNQSGVADVQIEGEIKIENRPELLKAESKTDAEGFTFLEFNLPDFELNADIDLKVVGKKGSLTRELEDELHGAAGKIAEIITDKPIYQPNQTVNLRLYSYNLNRLPVKNNELNIEIKNETNDEVTFTEKVKTSRFGIAAAAWKIPEGTKLGNYRIYVKNAEDDSIAEERIKITRYDLPNFYVEAKPDRKFYLPDQKTAKIEIDGKYLFGKVLTDAKVRIVSQERDKDEEIFKEITGTLNDEGKFSTEVDLSKAFEKFDPDNDQRFRDLHFSAYVTDLSTNRTEPRNFDIRITNEPIHVYLIGDTDNQSPRLPLNFYVSTFYADGTPASCDVGIYKLVEKDSDGKDIKAELSTNLAKIKTNSYGAAKLKLPIQLPENENDLSLKLVAKDGKGLTGSFEKEINTDDKAAVDVETDKTIYRKGEPIKVSIASSEQKGLVFIDVIKNRQPIWATQVRLELGHAEITLPYREDFKNTIGIAAYFGESEDNSDLVVGVKDVIYPTPTNLEIEARTQKDIYRPGEQVAVKFRSRNAERSLTEAVLGVLVIDKAVEDRARTEAEISEDNSFLNRTFTSRMADFSGQRKFFGDLTVSDVKSLDLSKPLSPDLELALEIANGNEKYEPQIKRSRAFRDDLDTLFTPYFKAKMRPVAQRLDKIFEEKGIYPNDEKSLREILKTQNIDFDELKDAWGSRFRVDFNIEKDYLKMTIWSFGADKLPDTSDDLIVLESSRKYFAHIGQIIDKAMRDYTTRTNGFITDYATFRNEMLRQNINPDELRDAWGSPYRFEFTIDRTNYVLTVKSNGKDRKVDILMPYNSDDFILWINRSDYFTVTKANLIKGFNEYVSKNKSFPHNETEMRNILLASGFNLDETKDIFGRSFYVQQNETANLAKFYRYQNSNLKVIKQKILTFTVRSSGQDGIKGNYDDFELANFSGAASEEEIDFTAGNSTPKKMVRQKTSVTVNGAIGGTVFDPNGAVIPNAEAKVTNASGTIERLVRSNENGEFFIDNLPKDVYSLQVNSPYFKQLIITNLSVESGILLEIDAVLEVGVVNSMVEVASSAGLPVDTSSSRISNSINISNVSQTGPGIPPSFTPRVRDYFAETLVWSPELITDKKGSAKLKFKMADSLTTWKLYAIGSDEDGNFGVVERELQTFQPFFAELDPPRILTEGDRIALPVPIRNYTDKRQEVTVSIAENDWSKPLNGAAQNIEIPANATANAVFNFQATTPVADGKQKVTARAAKDGDAIEKPVTVRPNGKEVVETQSNLFENEASFDVSFPQNAFPNTRSTEIKIYPNMLAHVAESVDGLLERPHGCGEQTTSSTYPNLLILKIEKELQKEIDPKIKAQAQSYLEEGYKRLLNYQTDSGGFSYWGKSDTPNIALTAYILRFLHDSEDFTEVDETVVEKAENWLLRQQNADGSWESSKGGREISTAYILRSLSLTAGTDSQKRKALQSGIEFLKKRLPEIKDPFVLANLALASQDTGYIETAQKAIEKLQDISQPNKESLYWTTEYTPFYGWGAAAQIETTALVIQALLRSKDEKYNEQITRGLSFLLKNKDRFGVWYSTQTTVNVLDALILFQAVRMNSEKNQNEKAEIYINGKKVQELSVSGGDLKKPIIFNASAFLNADNNHIEIKTSGDLSLTMAQIVSRFYTNWSDTKEDSRYFDLTVDFDKLQAKIGEEITCRVRAQKKFNNYGMSLAEIGLPPGADVDRASLEKAKSAGRISSYDILPDKVVVYSWAGVAPVDFSFKFRPRFGLNAQTAPSLIYDYYNEEAKTMLAPQKFEVK